MSEVSLWTDVDVYMSDEPGAEVTITGISKASEAIVLCATPPANGTFVKVKADGMTEVDGRVFRVSGTVSGTSFKLEGEDSLDYSTFTSGSFQTVAYNTTIASTTNVSGQGGEFEKIDVTPLNSKKKVQVSGLASALSYDLEAFYDASDATIKLLKKLSRTKKSRAFMIVFANGQRIVFFGQPSTLNIPSGSKGQPVMTKISIEASGDHTDYAN
jgi:hypothetical protein